MAPVPTLVDLCLLSDAWSNGDLPDHLFLRRRRIAFVRARRKVQDLLRFPRPHLSEGNSFVLAERHRFRLLWTAYRGTFIFECQHLEPGREQPVAEYAHWVRRNDKGREHARVFTMRRGRRCFLH